MITLYYFPGNASFAPHVLLRELGVPFALRLVDRAAGELKQPAFLKLNPNGVIPVLVDEGLVLYESAAICLHLADAHPQAELLPPLGTPERAQAVDFSEPYWTVSRVFIVPADSTLTPQDVLTKKVKLGVQRGTSEANAIKQEQQEKGYPFELRFYESAPLAVEDLLNGRIDAAAMNDAPAKDAAAKKAVQILGTFGMAQEDFGYAVRKDDKELLDRVNASLKKLMASPDWEALKNKYELNK